MKQWLGAAVASFVLVLAAPAHADPSERFQEANPEWGDAVAMGVSLSLAVGFDLWNPPPYARNGVSPGFDLWATDALEVSDIRAARNASNALLWTEFASALTLPLILERRTETDVANATFLGLESLLITYAVTTVAKDLVRRLRPDVATVDHQPHQSFFSGHTSMSFAAATSVAIYALEFDWGGDAAPAIGAVFLAAAATVGVLRIAAQRHWLSDVVTGALIGTGTTLILHAVHEQ